MSVLKSVFARHGVPEVVTSDNGTQFTSQEFQKFTKEWNFIHETSSPHFPQANGKAENGVKIAKAILRQEDPLLAILTYRATPIVELGASPAELAFGRKLRTTLPCLARNLDPSPVDPQTLRKRDAVAKQKQKQYYDRRHGARPLSELSPGQPVLLKGEKSWDVPGEVVEKCATRSYVVQTDKGELRRNRQHLLADSSKSSTEQSPSTQPDVVTETPQTDTGTSVERQTNITDKQPDQTVYTRSGRAVVKPARYRDD